MVPLSITVLLINLSGFPSTFKEDNFMKPKTVGNFVNELFSIFKKFKVGL